MWALTSYFGAEPDTLEKAIRWVPSEVGLENLDSLPGTFPTFFVYVRASAEHYRPASSNSSLRARRYIFNRTLFAASVAWFIVNMLNGRARWFNGLLSAQIWVPVARLSYSAYLLQFAAGYLVSCVVDGRGLDTVGLAFGNQVAFDALQIALSLVLAVGVWVVAEKPGMNVANWVSRGT
jgi:hypothetical protein